MVQLLEYTGIAALMILFTYGPPLSSNDLKVIIAFSLSFLSDMCFLIGVNKFFTWEFKWLPTLSDKSLNI